MRKRENWMKTGARVTACGDPGKITRFEGTNVINGIEYVYNIRVKLDGEKTSRVYHPADVKLIEDDPY